LLFHLRPETCKSRGRMVRLCDTDSQHGAHHVILARLTNIGCAMIQRFRPYFVIRQPVRAHDAQVGEFMMETLDFVRSRCFQIQHQYIGALPGNRQTNFFARTGQVNRVKVLGKADRQI
jgi:hypothetical protein